MFRHITREILMHAHYIAGIRLSCLSKMLIPGDMARLDPEETIAIGTFYEGRQGGLS